MTEDEEQRRTANVIPTDDPEIDDMRWQLAQKYELLIRRLEQQTARLNDIQRRLEERLSQEAGEGRWLTTLKIRLHHLWWQLHHR